MVIINDVEDYASTEPLPADEQTPGVAPDRVEELDHGRVDHRGLGCRGADHGATRRVEEPTTEDTWEDTTDVASPDGCRRRCGDRWSMTTRRDTVARTPTPRPARAARTRTTGHERLGCRPTRTTTRDSERGRGRGRRRRRRRRRAQRGWRRDPLARRHRPGQHVDDDDARRGSDTDRRTAPTTTTGAGRVRLPAGEGRRGGPPRSTRSATAATASARLRRSRTAPSRVDHPVQAYRDTMTFRVPGAAGLRLRRARRVVLRRGRRPPGGLQPLRGLTQPRPRPTEPRRTSSGGASSASVAPEGAHQWPPRRSVRARGPRPGRGSGVVDGDVVLGARSGGVRRTTRLGPRPGDSRHTHRWSSRRDPATVTPPGAAEPAARNGLVHRVSSTGSLLPKMTALRPPVRSRSPRAPVVVRVSGRGGVGAVAQHPDEGGDDDGEGDRADDPQHRVIHGTTVATRARRGRDGDPGSGRERSPQSHGRRAPAGA